MSTTADLVIALKKELKAAQMTYADLARALGMAESSVKRMLAKGDMPLSRIDAICRALSLDFADLARRVADSQPLLQEMTPEQENAVVADRKLLLMAICVLSQWTLEQIVATYRMTEAEGIRYLAQLDRIGIIELRPGNRYRLRLAKTFRWRARAGDGVLPRERRARLFRRRLRPAGRRHADGARLHRPASGAQLRGTHTAAGP